MKLVSENWDKKLIAKNIDRLMIALSICEKRIAVNSDEIFVNKDLYSNPETFKPISDDIHSSFVDLKFQTNFSKEPWFRRLFNQYKDTVNEETGKKVL